ncbi:MAG: glycoside hydrolase family 16 protein [Clostridia bacterium]|nr:glycoside hydrolase family 16 protein [Clostridia bacterium]
MTRKLTAFLLILTLLAGSPPAAFADDPAPEKEGYTLDFSAEFNDGILDAAHWLPQYLPHCTASEAGASARYEIRDGCLNLFIAKDSPDYFGGRPGSADPGNLLWIANGIQTWEKNHLHSAGSQQKDVTPFEGYATQYGYFEMRMKLPDTGGGGYASWWLIGTQDDALPDGTESRQNGEIDIFETFFKAPGRIEPRVHAWDDPNLREWAGHAALDGAPEDYVNSFHTYAMDWRPEGITFYVDGKPVAETAESPQYRMCMILSMYLNSDFSGWASAETAYPIEWLIDYVRVYKDNNGYHEENRPTALERYLREQGGPLCAFGLKLLLFFRNCFARCRRFLESCCRMDPGGGIGFQDHGPRGSKALTPDGSQRRIS